jgi:hypothetical protein
MSENRATEAGVKQPSAEALQLLLDKTELYELLQQYCRGVDRQDYVLLESLYHPDSTDDHSPQFKGTGPEFVRWLPTILRRYTLTSHVVTSALFTIAGDFAEGEAQVSAFHLSKKEPAREMIFHGRYLDRYERRQGVWRILERVTVHDWSELRFHDKELSDRVSSGVRQGRGDEHDPLYGRHKLVKRGVR